MMLSEMLLLYTLLLLACFALFRAAWAVRYHARRWEPVVPQRLRCRHCGFQRYFLFDPHGVHLCPHCRSEMTNPKGVTG